MGIHGAETLNQALAYAPSFDTNQDGRLSLMEYLPIGAPDGDIGPRRFSPTLYTGDNTPRSGTLDEVAAQLATTDGRPFVYVPYNHQQLRTMIAFWWEKKDALGTSYDPNDPRLANLTFPPQVYDGFVLIGNGPGGTDGGLCTVDPPGKPGQDYDQHYTYHILGLRIAFLATRDWPIDGKSDKLLDFAYLDRKMAATPYPLPDGTMGHGAFIKVVVNSN